MTGNEISAAQVTRAILARPDFYLLARWNWKSALLSAVVRCSLFLRSSSIWAPLVEFSLALAIAGFLGAFAQAYRDARPRWLALLLASGFPLGVLHICEFAVHPRSGVPVRNILFSILYSVVASAFTVVLMKRGIWLSGEEQTSLADDFRKIIATGCAAIHVPFDPQSTTPRRAHNGDDTVIIRR